MQESVIKIENLKKKYKLGAIGGATLQAEIQSWWARKTGKEDPNLKIGMDGSKFGETFWALNGINLEVKRGEALGIIGSNGAGKSTLLKLLSRVTAPTEGCIKVKGRISSMLEVGTGFHPELTGRENIYMNGAILGMSRKEVDSKIEDIIEFSECRKFIDTPVKRYSSGMYVKLAFSVAAHLDSEIMVMDEVLAVGDMKFQEKCLGKMSDASRNEGKTVLYVSHNMATIRKLCTRCIVLNHGTVIFDGDVEKAIEIYMDKASEDMKTCYEITTKKNFGVSDVRVSKLQFLNVKEPIFDKKKPILFAIDWECKEKKADLRLSITVHYADGSIVGMAESKSLVKNVEMGMHTTVIEFDASNLINGKHYFDFALFSVNSFGTFEMLDLPQNSPIWFELIGEDNDCISWQRIHWGNVKLNALKVCEE